MSIGSSGRRPSGPHSARSRRPRTVRPTNERNTRASLIPLLAKKGEHVATIATASQRLPLAARTGLHAFLVGRPSPVSGVRRESSFRDANGVRDPNVPEFALRTELVDGGGADPKKAGGFTNGKKSEPRSALRASGL